MTGNQENHRQGTESSEVDQDAEPTLNAPAAGRPDGREAATDERDSSGDQRKADDT